MSGSIFGYLDGARDEHLRLKRNLAKHEEWSDAILPADAAAATAESETNRRPLIIFGGIIAVALVALVGRLFFLQIVSGNQNLALANGNRIRETVERAPRGMIYDRNMTVLVQNQASYDVTVIPQELARDTSKREAEYSGVASLIGMSAQDVKAKADGTCKNDNVECLFNPVPQLVDSGIQRDQALLFDQDSNQFPGFALDINPTRQYMDNNLLSAVLGYTGRVDAQDLAQHPDYGPTDLIGKLGLEKQYESVLRGINGGLRTEVDVLGRPVKVLASQDPVPGDSLVLSIDQGLETELASTIEQQMQASGSIRAAGVAVNPNTGEVLASVSLPTYDNNEFSQGISEQAYKQLLADPGQPLVNKVTLGGYPSGSIVKPIGASGALQQGIINDSTIVDDTGKLVVPNPYDPSNPSIYYGWERTTGLGPVNVEQALAQSSDIFFYEVMGGFTNFTHYLGIDQLARYYQLFGLGHLTGIDIPGETPGRVPTPAWKKAYSGQPWYTGDTYNVAVGQGDLLVSPLQMVMALSAIANGGTLYQPHFLDKIIDANNKVVQLIKPHVVRSGFVSASNLAIVRHGMWLTVNEPLGTGCCKIGVQVPVQVAAKSGTAETVIHDNGDAADESKPDAWFEAFAPYDHPTIAIVVLLEHAGEGAQYAAPPVRETLAWYFTQGAGAGQH